MAEDVLNLLHEPGLGPYLQLPVGVLVDLPVFPGAGAVHPGRVILDCYLFQVILYFLSALLAVLGLAYSLPLTGLPGLADFDLCHLVVHGLILRPIGLG